MLTSYMLTAEWRIAKTYSLLSISSVCATHVTVSAVWVDRC